MGQSLNLRKLPRVLSADQIAGLSDQGLIAWYRCLKALRATAPGSRHEATYDNPRQIRWCFHEARRELRRRNLR